MKKVKNNNDVEENISNSVDEDIVKPDDFTTIYEPRSCAELFRLYKSNQLEIQPKFQRNVVWQPKVQTRFIDSLTKQMPIPSICIALDYKTERRIVIDGLQRISTIVKFFEDKKWKLSKIPAIDANISGKTVSTIKQKTQPLYAKVENATIPVSILKCDFSNPNHMDYLFEIFNRINTGGQKLNNQEIRNCIYSGSFNNLLREIANGEHWKNSMDNSKTSEKNRFENEELILRTFAFFDKLDDYDGKLAHFLNRYMDEKRNIDNEEIEKKNDILVSTLSLIKDKIDQPDTVYKLGKTIKEGLLVGIAKNITTLSSKSKEEIQSMFEDFVNDEEFSEENLKAALSRKTSVISRLKKSISIFGDE